MKRPDHTAKIWMVEIGEDLQTLWNLSLREDLPVIDVDAVLSYLVGLLHCQYAATEHLDKLPYDLFNGDFLIGPRDSHVNLDRLEQFIVHLQHLGYCLLRLFQHFNLFNQGKLHYDYNRTLAGGVMVLHQCPGG